jgi:glycosyltransferase involved in cell wall biosynthesis
MRALNVLHVIGGGDTGGAMSHLLPLLSALQRAGCNAHLLCLGEGGLAEEAGRRGLSVAVLPMSGAHDPRVLRPLRLLLVAGPAALARTGPSSPAEGAPGQIEPRWDVIHTHGMRANLPVRLAMRTLRERPCLLTTVHSDLRLDYASGSLARVYQGLDRATLGGVDGIVCVSDALRSLLLARGYPADRLITVRSGLEAAATGAVEPRAMGEEAVRRSRVGTVARLVAVKDIDLTLEVAGQLRRTHPEVEVVIVGDGPERERLEALAAGAGLAGVVTFAGRVDGARTLLGGFDVFLVTSVFEGGVSMAVLEAMEQGLPVVTTDAGGVAEAVVDGVTGYVVRRDLERGALAAALAEHAAALLDDQALRARMGAAGARRVRDHFTVEQTAAQTLRAYERCLVARDRH